MVNGLNGMGLMVWNLDKWYTRVVLVDVCDS
jgi:hypothetical protein